MSYHPLKLHFKTWQEVEEYLSSKKVVIIPIGSTEQHGPNGLIGTDALTSETLALGLAEKFEVLVAPTINVGMAQHHLAFPGSLSLRPSTLRNVIIDIITSFAKHGFERLFFINGHGGNEHTAYSAFDEYYAADSFQGKSASEKGKVRVEFNSWFRNPRLLEFISERFGDEEGFHATISEVSLTQYIYQESIKKCPPGMDNISKQLIPFTNASDFRYHYPDGRTCSFPHKATPEFGKEVYELSVSLLGEQLKHFIGS